MKKVWINPAFKDLVQPPKLEVKKEEKPVIIKEQTEPKPEKKKEKKEKKAEDPVLKLTEPVMEKIKEKGVNTEKLTDLLNKDITKSGLKEELKNRAFSDEDINHIVYCIRYKPSPPLPPRKLVSSDNIEHKLFQYLMEKQIPIEVKFLTGITFTGKIKWFSDWLINLEIKVKAKVKTVILNRLMMVCYYQMKENSLSEADLKKLPGIDFSGTEVKILQQYKDNKTPLLFHVQGGLEIKGTLEWYEKLIYHIRSLDGKTDHTIQRSIVLYFEEVV